MERHNCFKGFSCCKLYAKDYNTRKGILDVKGFLVPVYYTLKIATNPNPRSSGRDVHPIRNPFKPERLCYKTEIRVILRGLLSRRPCTKGLLHTTTNADPLNNGFVLSKKPVENRPSTNLCKSNLFAIPAEDNRTVNPNS